jgi:hypothetical protein
MLSKPRMLLIGACLGTLALATPVKAQPAPQSDISFDGGMLIPKKPKPGLPDVRAQPLAWPRLDPGAVLCRSKADLEKLAARRGGEAVDGAIDCQVVQTPTAISIVQRSGPGRVEVKISGSTAASASGWTDAWLPDKAPPGATSASR